MKPIPLFSKLTIYPKLVLSFLLVIVPILIFSLQMNESGKQVVSEQISQSLASQLHFYFTSFETEVSRLIRLKAEYVNDDDILKLSTAQHVLDDFERTQLILGVRNKLNLLESSSTIVENVKLYIPVLGRSIIANNFDDAIPEDELEAILNPDNHQGPIFSFQNQLFLSEIYPDTMASRQIPLLALAIELSKQKLRQNLLNMITIENAGAVLYGEQLDWFVSGTGDQKFAMHLGNQLKENISNVAESGEFQFKSDQQTFLVAHAYSAFLQARLVIYVPIEEVLAPVKRYERGLISFSVLSILLIGLFSYWIYRLFYTPLQRLVKAFRTVEKGDLNVVVQHRNQDEFDYLYVQFNHMVSRIRVLVHEVYEQQIRSQRSELKQLQTQINPHFLYNSFFILEGLIIMRNHELAEKMVHHLGVFLQYITRSGSDIVLLEQEVLHSQSYAEIQNMRFMGQIKTEFGELPVEWRHVPVPRLILQPILENAYRYGLEDKTENGQMQICFLPDGSTMNIIVTDNGESLTDEKLYELQQTLTRSEWAIETTGMLNVHRRLELQYGMEFGLTLSRSEWGGLKVNIRISKGEMEDEHQI